MHGTVVVAQEFSLLYTLGVLGYNVSDIEVLLEDTKKSPLILL